MCSTYNVTYCFDKSCCCRRYKRLPFQCEYNDYVTISSYVKGNYDFYDVEQIEEFIAWKGAYEIMSLLENFDDAPYETESLAIFQYCYDNYRNDYCFIIKYLNRFSPPKEETNALQEPMEEEIAETGSSLDEKEEESDDQEEEEWNYPCLPSDESNSLTHTLFDCPPCLPKEDECYIDECDDPIDSFEISLFDEIAACDTCAHDTIMNETCENDVATVIYDNPCYFDKSYDNPLFIPTIDVHDNEEVCLENLYDNALDDGPMLLDDINYIILKIGLERS